MYRSIPMVVTLFALIIAPSASGAIQQKAIVKLTPVVGTGTPAGNSNVKISAYLSTRDPASTRGSFKPNPVGSVLMTFPAGSGINVSATVGCKKTATSNPFAIKPACTSALIGEGWALISNLGVNPVSQLAEAPKSCSASDATQYTRTYEAGAPACTPRGFIWTHVYAYQGAMVNGVYKSNYIIFSNMNQITSLSFPGIVTGNKLSVILPALGGSGSEAGVLPLNTVLVDFQLNITNSKYLKAGPCPAAKKWTTTTAITYSKFSTEKNSVRPAPITTTSVSPCK